MTRHAKTHRPRRERPLPTAARTEPCDYCGQPTEELDLNPVYDPRRPDHVAIVCGACWWTA